MKTPTTYVAFLRGINVNGHRVIRMAHLKERLEEETSFLAIRTWMQSGNVLIRSCSSRKQVQARLLGILTNHFQLTDVPVMIRTAQEMKEIISNNPLIHLESKRLFCCFFDQTPTQERIQQLESVDYSPEEYEIRQGLIYYYVPNFAKYKLDTPLFERILHIPATSRNWRVTNRIAELAQELSERSSPLSFDLFV